MNSTKVAAQDDAESRRVIVNLSVRPNGETRVRSCEVVGPAFRNRTTFNGAIRPGQVFDPVLADQIEDLTGRLSGSDEVLALPSFSLKTPHCALSGAQVLCKKDEGNTLFVILRFRLVVGQFWSLFREEVGVKPREVTEEVDNIALGVLEDVALPILNICRLAESSALGSVNRTKGALPDGMSSRMCELEFQIELLKRYFGRNSGSVRELN